MHNHGPTSRLREDDRLAARPLSSVFRDRWAMLALGLLLILVNRAASLIVPLATKVLLDDVVAKSNASLLLPLTGAILFAYLLQAMSSLAVVRVLSVSALRFIDGMRRQVQQHTLRLPIAFHDSHKVGELVSRIMNDVECLRNLVGAGLVELVGGILSASLAVCVMFAISPTLTWVTLAAMAIFALILRSVFGRLRPLFQQRSELNASLTARLAESLNGIRVVKGYNGEFREAETFALRSAGLADNAVHTLRMTSNTSFWTTALTGVTGAVVTWVGGRFILTGHLQLGEFVMFMILLTYMTGPLLQVVNVATQLSESFAGLARCRQILDLDLEGVEPERLPLSRDGIYGALEFENVDFAYGEGSEHVLHGIGFRADPGTVTAFVGPSGSGKSTIIGLAAGFYTPSSGCVKVDSRDLQTVALDSYRSHIGMVLQETFLFDGTIRENVMFANPAACEADFLEACRIARLDDAVAQFGPLGYDTLVGERGVRLSGGQRQRISIARAVLADPKILILDEATSSLDSESEAAIQAALDQLIEHRTTLVIAHRLSTIRQASQILFVEAGEIVERGSHDELLAARGRYWSLYRRQCAMEANLVFAEPELSDGPEPVQDHAMPGRHRGRSPAQEAALSLLR